MTAGNQSLTDLNVAAVVGAGMAAAGVALTNGDILAAVSALTTAAADPAVGEVLEGSLYMQRYEQNVCEITGTLNGIPSDSIMVSASNGESFYMPAKASFIAEQNTGESNGLNPFVIGSEVLDCGAFDFQRSGSTYIPAYVSASNYGVGVYMEGAGYSQGMMDAMGSAFVASHPGANLTNDIALWNLGWQDAKNGVLAGTTPP